MAGTGDDLNKLKKDLSEFAKERLSKQQQGLLVAIFTAAAEHAEAWSDPGHETLPRIRIKDTEDEIGIPARTNVDELIAQLRNAFTPGEDRIGTICCVIPVIPVTPKLEPKPGQGPNPAGNPEPGSANDQ